MLERVSRFFKENWFPAMVMLVIFGPMVFILWRGIEAQKAKHPNYPAVPPNHVMIVTADAKGETKVTVVPNEVAKDFFHNPHK